MFAIKEDAISPVEGSLSLSIDYDELGEGNFSIEFNANITEENKPQIIINENILECSIRDTFLDCKLKIKYAPPGISAEYKSYQGKISSSCGGEYFNEFTIKVKDPYVENKPKMTLQNLESEKMCYIYSGNDENYINFNLGYSQSKEIELDSIQNFDLDLVNSENKNKTIKSNCEFIKSQKTFKCQFAEKMFKSLPTGEYIPKLYEGIHMGDYVMKEYLPETGLNLSSSIKPKPIEPLDGSGKVYFEAEFSEDYTVFTAKIKFEKPLDEENLPKIIINDKDVYCSVVDKYYLTCPLKEQDFPYGVETITYSGSIRDYCDDKIVDVVLKSKKYKGGSTSKSNTGYIVAICILSVICVVLLCIIIIGRVNKKKYMDSAVLNENFKLQTE